MFLLFFHTVMFLSVYFVYDICNNNKTKLSYNTQLHHVTQIINYGTQVIKIATNTLHTHKDSRLMKLMHA